MTKEEVQARLTQLETEQQQVLANLSAYNGAIAEAKYWLEQLNKETTTNE